MADDAKRLGAKGGKARAAKMTKEERSSSARSAALARWAQAQLRATHRGNFEEEFGIDVDCYVLDDEFKTAVISKRGMAAALGLAEGGSALSRFVSSARMLEYVGEKLRQKLDNPLVFRFFPVGQNAASGGSIHGYDVTILVDVCKAILKADEAGTLKGRPKLVRQAHVILNASAKAGIKGLVYALAGYDATRAEVIAAFKFFVREEAREYEREFPNDLYEQWYRLYDVPRPEKNRPWKFKDLTIKHVYTPLARSNGRILDLTRAQRAKREERHKKLHQFLSDIGVKALRVHLGKVLGIALISESRAQYERHVEKVFGPQLALDLGGA